MSGPKIISSISIPPDHVAGQPLRFPVGTRVEVCYDSEESAISVSRSENGSWVPATVVAQDYRQSGWCAGSVAAYLVRLEVDDYDSLPVREDDGRCIRSMFKRGSRVDIFGLQKRKDLNGKMGTVVKFKTASGRYRVRLFDARDEFVLLKPSSLKDADEALFADPPPPEDCAVCMLPMPYGLVQGTLQLCCGKSVCAGCIIAEAAMDPYRPCPFCRAPTPANDQKLVELNRKRIESGDGNACVTLGHFYLNGFRGLPLDHERGLQLWRKGAEWGFTVAQYNLGGCYAQGSYGAERDMERACHFFELAARSGHVHARMSLADIEEGMAEVSGDYEEKCRHFRRGIMHNLIAAKSGLDDSLERVKIVYKGKSGIVTKEEFAAALRGHKDAKDAIRSEAREKAAVAFPTSVSIANADKLRLLP